jgi:hypothetical protein
MPYATIDFLGFRKLCVEGARGLISLCNQIRELRRATGASFTHSSTLIQLLYECLNALSLMMLNSERLRDLKHV